GVGGLPGRRRGRVVGEDEQGGQVAADLGGQGERLGDRGGRRQAAPPLQQGLGLGEVADRLAEADRLLAGEDEVNDRPAGAAELLLEVGEGGGAGGVGLAGQHREGVVEDDDEGTASLGGG